MFQTLKSLLRLTRSDAMDAAVEDPVWRAVLACKRRTDLPKRGRRSPDSLPDALASLGRAVAKEAAAPPIISSKIVVDAEPRDAR